MIEKEDLKRKLNTFEFCSFVSKKEVKSYLNFVFILVFIHLFVFNKTGFSQTEKAQFPEKASLNKEYLESYLLDIRDIVLKPKYLSKSQWCNLGIVLGTTGLLMTIDGNIQSFVQKNKTASLNDFSKNFVEPFGNVHLYRNYTLLSLGVLYLHGSFMHNERQKKVAMLATKAFAITGMLVYIPKTVFGRHTPGQFEKGFENPHFWSGPGFGYQSFFSGHTSVVFSVASIVASEYSNSYPIKILAYGLAGLVGVSRIYDNAHWASDVFLGACFGYAVGKIIYNTNNWGIHLNPLVSSNFYGMNVVYDI